MPDTTVRASTASAADRLGLLLPLVAGGALAAGAATLGPESLTSALIALFGVMVVAVRPQWGVAIILVMLMVQYGARGQYERGGVAGITSLVPAGEGLMTVNNLLGVFLALLLVYHVYRDAEWSFVKSRQLQLMALLTVALVFSGFVSGIDVHDQLDLGLRLTGAQDPSRQLISRMLFLVLFVFFIQRPRDLRMIIGIFVALAVATAWSGSAAAIFGGGRPEVADYRAGGVEVLIESTQNPNRLALISTLALVFIWEYSQAHNLRRWAWLAVGAALLMIVTVFLSASRGGVLGLGFSGLMLFVRKRGGSSRIVYGAAVVVIGWVLISQVVPEQAIERITNLPGLGGEESQAEGEGSIQRRQYTYEFGMRLWTQAPVVGIGPGNWPYVRFINDPMRSAAAPHSAYLKALVEGGIVSFGLYMLLFGLTVRDLWNLERSPAVMERARADNLDWVVAATRVCLVSFMVFSLFADLWDLVFAYLLVGMGAVLIKRYQPWAAAPPAAALPVPA